MKAPTTPTPIHCALLQMDHAAPMEAATSASPIARLRATRLPPLGSASPISSLLLIMQKKVKYAIGSSTMPKMLVGCVSKNLASALPHKKRKPSAPVIPGSSAPVRCTTPPIFAPIASVRQKPLISIRMMMVEIAIPSTPMPKMTWEVVFLSVVFSAAPVFSLPRPSSFFNERAN